MHAKNVFAVQLDVGIQEVFSPMVFPHASPYEDAPVDAQTRPIRLYKHGRNSKHACNKCEQARRKAKASHTQVFL